MVLKDDEVLQRGRRQRQRMRRDCGGEAEGGGGRPGSISIIGQTTFSLACRESSCGQVRHPLKGWTERNPDGQIEMLSDARHQIPWPMSALSNALDDTTLTMSERQRERQRVRVREERGG
jgi:hypothetical protein